MNFAPQFGGSTIETARATQAVLFLGRSGQGVGLLCDLLSAAAADCGWPVVCEEMHGSAMLGSLSAAAVWLGTREASQAAGFDVVVALDRAAAREARRFARPSARILLPATSPADLSLLASRKFFVAPRRHAISPSAASLGYFAGSLSECLSLPAQAWKNALAEHIRPRDLRRAQTAFVAACRQSAVARSTAGRFE